MVEKTIKKTVTKKPAATTTNTKKPVTKSNTNTATTTTTTTNKKTTTTTTTNKKINNELEVGKKIKAIVTEIRNFELILKYKEYTCKVHCLNSELAFGKEMINQEYEGTILSIDETAKIIILTFIKPEPLTREFQIGQTVTCINYGQISYYEIAVWISPTQIGYLDVISNFKKYSDFTDFSLRKKSYKCLIKSINSDNKIYLSLIDNNPYLNKKLNVGDKIFGAITEINTLSMKIRLYNNLSGEVKLIDCCDQLREKPFSIYSVGTILYVYVKSITKDGIQLSLQKSLLIDHYRSNPRYQHQPSVKRQMSTVFSNGSHAWGYVIEKNQQIIRVELADKLHGIIQIEQLGQLHMHRCQLGSLVQITVISEPRVEGSNQVVNCTIRIDKKYSIQTLKKDDIVPLEVIEVKEYGLFVRNNNITALVHIKEVSDDQPTMTPEDLKSQFSIGDLVLGKCIGQKFSQEKRKNFFNFSLKSCHFESIDTESYFKTTWDSPDVEEEQQPGNSHIKLKSNQLKSLSSIKPYLVEKDQKKGELSILQLNKLNQSKQDNKQEVEEDDNSGDNDDDDDDAFKSKSLFDETLTTTKSTLKRKLQDSDDDDDEGELEENEIVDKKKQKIEKLKSKNKIEDEIKKREDLLADNNVAPESPQDFERLLLGSPNSSYLWIKYMSYYLSLSEINKAREVAEKAIKKIIPTEVLEQRNIWISLYNLENLYGTSESLLKLFQRSIQYQDPKTMYLTIIQILESTGKIEKCEEYFKMLFKKTKSSAKIWCRYGEFLLKNQKLDQFNGVLSRALECLPKKKQIKVINKFAQLEYRLGDVERGRTIFEGLITNYPNRTDIWNIYIDMELKSIKDNATIEHKDKIRQLFTRCINLKVSDRNIKQFFKRFLQFEKDFGNTKSIEDVKKMALKFVETN